MNSKKNKDILQKRVPKNPKYQNVESTIDTGASISRYMKRIEEIKQNYKIRNDELFKRMKITTFVQLVLQVAEINGHLYCSSIPEDNDEDHPYQEENDTISIADTIDTVVTQRSTFQSVITGMGELDIHEERRDVTKPLDGSGDKVLSQDEMPYLLLDVRERDEYDACHIIKSMSYPAAMICRSVNFESREMLTFRNKEGKIIVLYDEDERVAPRVADTLVQRGYDNLFLLSGGLRVAYKRFPGGLVTGFPPPSVLEFAREKTRQPTRKGSRTISTFSTRSDSVDESMRSEYTMQDLAKLSLALDSVLDSQSSTNSVGSACSRQSSLASRQALSVSSSSVDHKKPFRC